MGGGIWFFVVAIGPLLLALAIYWSRYRDRKVRNPRDRAIRDEGTRELREDIRKDPEYRQE